MLDVSCGCSSISIATPMALSTNKPRSSLITEHHASSSDSPSASASELRPTSNRWCSSTARRPEAQSKSRTSCSNSGSNNCAAIRGGAAGLSNIFLFLLFAGFVVLRSGSYSSSSISASSSSSLARFRFFVLDFFTGLDVTVVAAVAVGVETGVDCVSNEETRPAERPGPRLNSAASAIALSPMGCSTLSPRLK